MRKMFFMTTLLGCLWVGFGQWSETKAWSCPGWDVRSCVRMGHSDDDCCSCYPDPQPGCTQTWCLQSADYDECVTQCTNAGQSLCLPLCGFYFPCSR